MAELTPTEYTKLLATFVVQTATNAPTNAQVLGSLGTGLVKVATTTGVLSTAAGGSDYEVPLTFTSPGVTRTSNTVTNDLVTGLAGGQTVTGGTAASDSITIRSTSNGTKGFINLGSTTTVTIDETNVRIGVATAAPECALKIGNTSLGLSAFFGASSLPCLIGVQQAAGTFPGIVIGNDSTHQIRMYWQDSSAQISTSGGVLDISPATAVTFYTSTGGRIANDGSWLMGNVSTNAISKLRFVGPKTIASSAPATWNSLDLTASTLTITGNTAITTVTGLNFFNIAAPTYTAGSAVAITAAATLAVGGAPAATGAGPASITSAYAFWVQADTTRLDGNLSFKDASNVVLGTSTGTKIGTGTTQRLGFWNATPVVQPASTGTTTAGYTANASANAVVAESTFTGNTGSTAYTVSDIVKNLKTAGILAA